MSHTARSAFADLIAHFSSRSDVELPAAKKSGFGSAALRCSGKIFAMCPDDRGLVVKLPAARVGELIVAGQAKPYSTVAGKPMKEWALIPAGHHAEWIERSEEALAYVRGASGIQPRARRA